MKQIEAKIQAEIFQWFWNNYPQYRRLFFHIPNGGKRSQIEASRFKAMGVIAGVPDMLLAMGNCKYHGFFIEFKKPGEKIPDYQQAYHELLRSQRYKVECFSDVDQAKKAILWYIGLL